MLLRKMLRDMRSNITQFVSIFIMSILGVLIYAGINAEWYGMKTEVDRYYKDTHLPYLWVMSDHFTDKDLQKVKGLPGVTDAALRYTIDVSTNRGNNATLRINIVNDGIRLSAPKVTKGSSFARGKDGLWLDSSFAKANKLDIGDMIAFKLMGAHVEKRVRGLIMHPEYIHDVKDESSIMPAPKSFGFAFLNASQLPNGIHFQYNQILINNSGKDTRKMKSRLESMFSDRYVKIIDRDSHPSVAAFQSEIEQNKAMGGVFPIVFFLIAVLAMFTTMTRMTNNQRTQIGTLKALGFGKTKVLMHYISYGIWIGLSGGIIGLLSGPLIIPPILFEMQKSTYILPQWRAIISPSSFLITVIAVLCCGLSSYFACIGQLKEVPAATLRPKAPRISRHSRIEKSRLWHNAGFSVQWNFRDIIRSKVRSAMAVVGVLGCTALLLFGLGLRDSVDQVSSWMYKDLNVYRSKINLDDNATKENIQAIGKAYKGQWIQESAIELKKGTIRKSGALTVLGIGNEIKFEDKDGNRISLRDNGIGVSYKMSQLIGAGKGSFIDWRIYGEKKWRKSKISVIFRTPMDQGIAISKEAFKSMGDTLTPSALLTHEKVNSSKTITGVKSIQDKNELMDSFNSMLDSMRMIIVILVFAAIILGSVVIYNLGALSFTERNRELATLKVLGFFPKQIRSLLQVQNIWLTIIGIIIGIPAGYALIGFMLSTMSDSTDMVAQVSVTSLVISVGGTFLLSVVVNGILSRRIKSIDMVTSLKGVE